MIKISFADLTHTGQSISANTIPCGISMVAAYAKSQLGSKIEIEIFRYPEDFSKYLEKNDPQIVCFSALSWNMELSHTFAKLIKSRLKKTITVFGGPNFPMVDNEKKDFLKIKYPYIDFFVEGEGEIAFVELFKKLESVDFDQIKFKENQTTSPNVRYVYKDNFISSEMFPRIKNLDIIPSIYLTGISDKFFDEQLIPVMQTARGCPYKCSFCNIASTHWQKVSRFSMERIKAEINYVAQHSKVKELQLADDNFGIFKQDVETAKALAKAQNQYDFPNYVTASTAKNNKDRIREMAKILQGRFNPGASIQSSDPQVLDNIHRVNLPINELAKISKDFSTGHNSFTEIILALPGDTKEAHFKSNLDLIDVGFSIIRNHQFMLLEGTEAYVRQSREKFNMKSLFHIQPRCFGFYEAYGKKFFNTEIEEICVGTDSMTYKEYQECRSFNLTVEIFVNDALFYDLIQYLNQKNISAAKFIKNVHEYAIKNSEKIRKLYKDYEEEEKNNFWSDRKKFENFLKSPEVIKRYIAGELGTNEIYKYRSIAVFYNMEELHNIVYEVARSLLPKNGSNSEVEKKYLDELYEFSLLRKKDFFNIDLKRTKKFHFDFARLAKDNFRTDPLEAYTAGGIEVDILHSDWQKNNINIQKKKYGESLQGLLRIFSQSQPNTFYRSANRAKI